MHNISVKPKRVRYKGRKGKLIHLDPKVFEGLTKVAEFKNMKLKNYIEELCRLQLNHEIQLFLQEQE